jgi:hypothetical protein
MLARPERALDGSPIRDDTISHAVLAEFMAGVRDQVSYPYELPKSRATLGLTGAEAATALHHALRMLRAWRPALHARLMATAPPTAGRRSPRPRSGPPVDPERDHLPAQDFGPTTVDPGMAAIETAGERIQARAVLTREVLTARGVRCSAAHPVIQPSACGGHGTPSAPATIRILLDLAYARELQVDAATRRRLNLYDPWARREAERLARHVADAGVGWTDQLLAAHDEDTPPLTA